MGRGRRGVKRTVKTKKKKKQKEGLSCEGIYDSQLEDYRVETHVCGARTPITRTKEVDDHIYQYHALKNRFIEHLQGSIKEYNSIIERYANVEDLDFQKFQEDIEEKVEQLKAQRAYAREFKALHGHRKRDRTPQAEKKLQEITAPIKKLNAEVKALKALQKEIKAKIAETEPAQKEIKKKDEGYKTQILDTYGKGEAYWGTKMMSLESFNQIQKSKGFPHFRKYRGGGMIGVQIQGGATPEEIFSGKCSYVQIDPLPPGIWDLPKREQKKLNRTTLRLRIGSLDSHGNPLPAGKTPVWTEVPFILHRAFPKGTLVMRVRLVRKKKANRSCWQVHFLIRRPILNSTPKTDKLVAIDIGWRRVKGGLRIAYTFDGENHREIILPEEILDTFEHNRSLRSIRDKNRDAILARLVEWKKANNKKLSDWFKERTPNLHKWKSQRSFARLLNDWKENRFEGDDEIFEALFAWHKGEFDWYERKQRTPRMTRWYEKKQRNQRMGGDLHMFQHEAGENSRALGRRKDLYRVIGNALAKEYQGVIWEDIKLDTLARRQPPEKEDALVRKARDQRQQACLSGFRDALNNAFEKEGRLIMRVHAKNTTATCHKCQTILKFRDRGGQFQTCIHCGATWDRDENAARNIHARGLELLRQHESAPQTEVVSEEPEATPVLVDTPAQEQAGDVLTATDTETFDPLWALLEGVEDIPARPETSA